MARTTLLQRSEIGSGIASTESLVGLLFGNGIVRRSCTHLLANTIRVYLGFTIQNEEDGPDVCHGNPDLATFWWGQAEKISAIVKQAAPDKLVGMATHDDPNIPAKAASYMAQCPSIDYWGVNTYQTVNFNSIFDGVPNLGPGYNGLTASR